MSEVAQLLRQIAKEIGREASVVQPFIDTLENNFYESIESIKDLTSSDYKEFNFPKRIADLLLQKVASAIENKGKIQEEQVPITKNEKISPEEEARLVIQDHINSLKNSIVTPKSKKDLFEKMKMIFGNILANPTVEKYRKIKQSNQIYQLYFLPNREAVEALLFCGFQVDEEYIFLDDKNLKLSILQVAKEEVQKAEESVSETSFNPFQGHTSANGVLSSNSLAVKEGFINYFDELNKLKAKRIELMAQPITDRKVRVFKATIQPSQTKNTEIDAEYEEDINDESLNAFQTDIKKMIQSLGEQKFMSRSKMEYQALLQEPLYTKCTIRIKFPQGIILEGLFGPLETMDKVVEFVKQNLEVPEMEFIVFQAIPRIVLEKKYLKMTLQDLTCIPGANFHFGVTNPEDEKKTYFLHSRFNII